MPRLLPLILAALVAAVMSAPASAAAGGPLHCTIVAGPTHVIVRGTRRADVICAMRGRHVVYGLAGNDTIYTGAGNDVVYAGPGNDTVHAGAGNDHVYGGSGRNVLYGGAGTDLLVGGSGSDLLQGGRGADTLMGKPGADILDGGAGNDLLTGGTGNDTLNGGPGNDDLNGGPGDNTCAGDGGTDTLSVWCDTQAPQLVSLTFSQTTIDTSQAPVQITATAHITDDGVGLLDANLVLGSGSNGSAIFDAGDRISGTSTDGVYQATLYFPQYAPQGEMPIHVDLWDTLYNHRALTSAQLAAAGMLAEIDQAGAGDTAGPQLVSMSLLGDTVDTSSSAQTLSMDLHITDDTSGLSYGLITWRSPDGTQVAEGYVDGPYDRVSGDEADGDYVVQIPFPQGSEQGSWTVQGYSLTDHAGNTGVGDAAALEAIADADLTIEQTGIGDAAPPQLQSVTITPNVIDDTDGQTLVEMTAHASDDLSGVAQVECDVNSPGGRQTFTITAQIRAGEQPVLDGTLTGGQWVDAGWAQPGVWTGSCFAIDMMNNHSAAMPMSVTFL